MPSAHWRSISSKSSSSSSLGLGDLGLHVDDVARGADARVHLGPQALTDADGAVLADRVVGDDDRAQGHPIPDDLGGVSLVQRDRGHLRSDLACARPFNL